MPQHSSKGALELMYGLTFSHSFLAVRGQKSEMGHTGLMRTCGQGRPPSTGSRGRPNFLSFSAVRGARAPRLLAPFSGFKVSNERLVVSHTSRLLDPRPPASLSHL